MTVLMRNSACRQAMTSSATFMSRLKLRRCAELGSSPSVVGRIWIHGKGTLRIGNRVRLDASVEPIELYVGPGAEMVIGDDVDNRRRYIASGTPVRSKKKQMQDRSTVQAAGLYNFHQLAKRLEKTESVPVVIDAGAILEDGAIVLPGAHVRGGGSVDQA